MMRKSRRPWLAALAGGLALIAVGSRPAPAQEAPAPDVDAKIRTSIDTMVKAIEEGNDPMRNKMFFELRIIGNASVPPLVELMKDSRVKVREYAIHTVSYIDDERWIDPVLQILRSDPEPSTRAMACRALARTQDTPVLTAAGRKAIPVLIDKLKTDQEVVAMDAAFALGWFGDPVARPALEDASKSSSELVSFFAKEALDNIAHAEKMKKKGK
ncbi:MAG: HEAT repeat domain-containing protein [bacterium]